MKNQYNAKCPICGKGFKICRTCSNHDLFSWKTVTDTEDCFKIFTILHKYNVLNTLTKDEAKIKLKDYDLSERNTFPNHIKKLITEIIGDVKVAEEKTEKKATAKVLNNTTK